MTSRVDTEVRQSGLTPEDMPGQGGERTPDDGRDTTMALARWTPMRNLMSSQDDMNRLFNEFFRGGAGEEAGWGARTWAPPVDIYETDDALVLKAELPGVSKDDVSIETHQNTLILRGQRQHEAEVKDEQYHRVERAYGTFQRSFVLPTLVDQEHVQAT
jgi:HSP20 family protein